LLYQSIGNKITRYFIDKILLANIFKIEFDFELTRPRSYSSIN